MRTEVITTTSQEHWLEIRKTDVTSTESAALFGMSPYMTHYDLWHLLDVIHKYHETMLLPTALGCLDLAKAQLIQEHMEDEDE